MKKPRFCSMIVLVHSSLRQTLSRKPGMVRCRLNQRQEISLGPLNLSRPRIFRKSTYLSSILKGICPMFPQIDFDESFTFRMPILVL